ncbi:hypothetical protein Gbro_1154 [Gordonia bronchialis DSM 43247]|uniref:Lipase class 2 n=1 Tax=Gordonia bronchialis (strain ATCC 25592 / DSM 43247 / BCRC 13721 / JCM 3198 / KCTC 3076 / NBRC 16047 / NCTC 10667) TaxID=526226 RepID=D0L510_GORB4|nr:hypothetical protein Gbro_1154 [Gordonia bronchialis DSM 43247]STQ63267.1 Extracellular esterase estB precursor [Gordonia bronchialis]
MRRDHSGRWLAALVIGAVLSVLSVSGAGSALGAPRPDRPLPVAYDVRVGILAELAHPGGNLPGTNDFGCRPNAVHPRPVILVHGSGGGRQTNWGALAPVLHDAGYCVFAPTYGAISDIWPASAIGGIGPKVDSAWQIKLFAEKVLAATGARQVDIVGHSLGTEIPTYWLRYLGGADEVDHYVSLAPYWRQGPDSDDTRARPSRSSGVCWGSPARSGPRVRNALHHRGIWTSTRRCGPARHICRASGTPTSSPATTRS